MLRQQLIYHDTPTSSKRRKYVLTSIAIASTALFLVFYLSSHYQYDGLQYPSKDITLASWGRDIKNKFYPCPKRHKIAYIWTFGEMPEIYKDFVRRCKNNIIILDEVDFLKYIKLWNDKYPQNAIKNIDRLARNTKNDYLKRLYLYFEGGIYSDFDTEINEECWEDFYTDKVIHTNTWGAYDSYSIPEQNFMRVLKPFNQDLKQWIIELNYESRWMGNRWDRCRREQCLILFCQNHNYDNSWVDVDKS